MRLPQITLFLFLAFTALQFLSCDPTRRMTEQELADTEVSTFILVRHAEKDFGDDPNLVEIGRQRAELLKEMFTKLDLDAVYTTDTKRTVQTAEPTAEYHDLRLQYYSAFELNALATKLRSRHRGETVLVVGHSNTTPALASILDKRNEYPRFSELDYKNLLVVTVPPKGAVEVLNLRF
ncbi:hypothetical protein CEQ90_04665 [Lewinellaceae bacterium SD302]|nr:hypothetical protein CEQ90_04665 [Lewinellaceae bacterium SD302]